ncbi:MAG: hypothetical protein K2X48_06255 [Chitinophagaceae bacterium]|nr:hypothetical protein [Chitinophagaceae bacterium]
MIIFLRTPGGTSSNPTVLAQTLLPGEIICGDETALNCIIHCATRDDALNAQKKDTLLHTEMNDGY